MKNSNQFWLCISGCRAAEIQIDSTEVSTVHSSHCVALLHNFCLPCFQTRPSHMVIFTTRSRWLKFVLKRDHAADCRETGQSSFTLQQEGHTQSLGPKRSVHFSKGTLRHVKIQEREGPSQGVIQHSAPHELMSVALMLPNLRTDIRKKPSNKNDAPH